MTELQDDNAAPIDEARLTDVVGGAAYIKFDGVDGESAAHGPPPGGVTPVFGDGSVKLFR